MKKGSSLTEKVVSWHLVEDTLWGAVLIGAGIMAMGDVPIIDPLLSIGISLFVLWNVGRNLTKVMKVFLQTTPESFDVRKFEQQVKSFPKLEDAHHIHRAFRKGDCAVACAEPTLQRGARGRWPCSWHSGTLHTLHVVLPKFSLLNVGNTQFPILLRVVNALRETLSLFVFGLVEKDLDEPGTVAVKMRLH